MKGPRKNAALSFGDNKATPRRHISRFVNPAALGLSQIYTSSAELRLHLQPAEALSL